ncbi:MAG: MBL fold metallo-hydrolase [Myxococcales bacterium]|nr:MBL fold metallo-hydrolase [Myxococcales bacterium]
MKIRWNGHSSFTITTANGTVIVLDPYEPGAFGGGIAYRPIDVKPDIVVISHDHADHNYTAGFKKPFIEVRQNADVNGIVFRALETFHDEVQGAKRGRNLIFIIKTDGMILCHLGDLGHKLSDAQLKEIGKVDVLMGPIGGFYTIDARTAAEVVSRINPRIFIPMHFKTDKCKFPISPVADFLAGKSNVKQLAADELEMTADKLPHVGEIIVLRHHY